MHAYIILNQTNTAQAPPPWFIFLRRQSAVQTQYTVARSVRQGPSIHKLCILKIDQAVLPTFS